MAYKIKMTLLVVWFIIPIIMINWCLSMIKRKYGIGIHKEEVEEYDEEEER